MVYQIKSIGENNIIKNGYEIAVIGQGENGLCEVRDRDSCKHYSGTYDQCVEWLRARRLVD